MSTHFIASFEYEKCMNDNVLLLFNIFGKQFSKKNKFGQRPQIIKKYITNSNLSFGNI